MKKYIVEFIGTFFLVLVIGNVVINPPATGSEETIQLTTAIRNVTPPLAIGTVLIAVIFGGGHVSAAHYNPAVTLAALLRGSCAVRDVVPYIAMQIAAAATAGFTVIFLKGPEVMETVVALKLDNVPQVLVAEILGTFLLVWVILNVATAKGTEGNSFYGVAIGFTVTAMIYAFGSISGAVFNPAVAVGICMMGLASWNKIWIYLAANFVGG
ncbi:MAG: MIP/aquaporin family protein, partial [Planctomycetaceae bacterium]